MNDWQWVFIHAFLTLSWLLQNLWASGGLHNGLDKCAEQLWVSLLIKSQTAHSCWHYKTTKKRTKATSVSAAHKGAGTSIMLHSGLDVDKRLSVRCWQRIYNSHMPTPKHANLRCTQHCKQGGAASRSPTSCWRPWLILGVQLDRDKPW